MNESRTKSAAPGEGRETTKKILAIDDEPDVLELLRHILEKNGYLAVTAPSGTEGLIRTYVERPDLILLDIMMEEMDGWETLRLLKLDESSCDIPVVVLSARTEPKDKIRALQEGAVDYITKPFSVRETLEKIRAILEARPAAGDRDADAKSDDEVEDGGD